MLYTRCIHILLTTILLVNGSCEKIMQYAAYIKANVYYAVVPLILLSPKITHAKNKSYFLRT